MTMDDKRDPIILNFHNTLVRQSDLALLKGPHWLNDTIIGFYFEYLEHVVCKDFAERVVFVCPEIVQFLKRADSSEVGPFLESMNLADKEYVFMAVNNSLSQVSPGGTHWSLLLFRKAECFFHHYDSFGHVNAHSAKSVMRNVSAQLCGTGTTPKFIEEDSTQQTNSYDCGIHVILNVNVLVRKFFYGGTLDWYRDDAPTAERAKLRDLILSLAGKNEKAVAE